MYYAVSFFGYCVMDSVAFFTNAVLIVLILQQDYTRKRRINLQIVQLSVTTCLRMVVLVVTLTWTVPGYHMCKTLQFLNVWTFALSELIILLINVDRFIALLFPNTYARLRNKWYSAVMLAGPMVFSFVLYLGLFLGGGTHFHHDNEGRCGATNLKPDVLLALEILMFFVPTLIVFGLGTTITVTYAIKIRKSVTESPDDIPEGRTQALLTLGLVDIFHIGMWLPINIYIIRSYFCTDGQCSDYILAQTVWLSYANLVMVPFLWAIHKDIRRAFNVLFYCICRRRNPNFGGHDNIAMTSSVVTNANSS